MPTTPGGEDRPLRVLVTQFRLADRSGTELYAFELARALIGLGHQAAIYSPRLGPLAEDARAAGVPVVDDPVLAGDPPDVIHGQHLLATLAAMLAFPTVPAVYLCHDATYWQDTPPPSSRVVRHLAVGEASRCRLVEDGVPPGAIQVVPNWVDLDRFRPRGRLPDRPRRALVFSNYTAHLEVVRKACAELGLSVDIVGLGVGHHLLGRGTWWVATTWSSPRDGARSRPWPWGRRWWSAMPRGSAPWSGPTTSTTSAA